MNGSKCGSLIKNRTDYQRVLDAAATVSTFALHPPHQPQPQLIRCYYSLQGRRPVSVSKLPLVLVASLGPHGDRSACADAASPGNNDSTFRISAFSLRRSHTLDRRAVFGAQRSGFIRAHRSSDAIRLRGLVLRGVSPHGQFVSRRGETATRWQM